MNYTTQLKVKKNDPSWLKAALEEQGKEVKEDSTKGKDNDRIVAYLKSTSLKGKINDEIPWCSAFVNWCIIASGITGTNTAWAKDWGNWGTPIKKPTRGCIVVFERRYKKKGKWTLGGHVGFYMGKAGDDILVLGGNQNDEINITKFKSSDKFITSSKHRVLGYRTFLEKKLVTIKPDEKKSNKTNKQTGSKHKFSRTRVNNRK